MDIQQRLTGDLKKALLAGETERVTVLRGLKSVILYAEVAEGKRGEGLLDEQIVSLFQKEAKKRQESADLYVKAGEQARADKELAEKAIIEEYLPEQMSEDEIRTLIDQAVQEIGSSEPRNMGQIIGLVKQKTQGAADGSVIARLVKERIN